LKKILADLHNFLDFHTCITSREEQILFWEYDLVQLQ
jgi:hypothetical protein